MADNKLKKKIALIQAATHAFGIHPGIDAGGKMILEGILESSITAKSLWSEEKFEESRNICYNNLSALTSVAQTLSPARLRKALLRQLEKITKY